MIYSSDDPTQIDQREKRENEKERESMEGNKRYGNSMLAFPRLISTRIRVRTCREDDRS